MAIQLPTYTTDQGVDVPNVYIVIEELHWTKNGGGLFLGAAMIYKSLQARNQGKKPLGYVSFLYDLTAGGGGFQAHGYAALKLLPEMAGAIDI